MSSAMLLTASSAAAATHHPKGEFASFADCPLSNPATTLCTVGKTESGEFDIAKEKVPIVNTITIQGVSRSLNPGKTSSSGRKTATLSRIIESPQSCSWKFPTWLSVQHGRFWREGIGRGVSTRGLRAPEIA